MRVKNLNQLLILCLTIARIASYGQTASSNSICLTPEEYRFFDNAVIERQGLAKENKSLNSAVKSLLTAHVADSCANTKLESVIALNGEKEAVYADNINKLQDKLDTSDSKVLKNRKIALVMGGGFTLELGIIIYGIWALTH